MNNGNSGKFIAGSIVTVIILIGLVLAIMSTMKDVRKNVTAPASMEPEAVQERIKPIAQVEVGEPPAVQAPPAEESSDDSSGGVGEKIVSNVCSACHGAGLMGSPKIGNAKDWAQRIEKGMDTLHDHAINGFNMMPARGGHPDLTDEEVMAAVDYMVSKAK
jgi:cytochrome c5